MRLLRSVTSSTRGPGSWPMMSASVGCAAARPATSNTSRLVRATTAASRWLAVATGRAFACTVDLRVRAIAEDVFARLHRRIGEVLAAIARHDRAARDQRERYDATAEMHRGSLRRSVASRTRLHERVSRLLTQPA